MASINSTKPLEKPINLPQEIESIQPKYSIIKPPAAMYVWHYADDNCGFIQVAYKVFLVMTFFPGLYVIDLIIGNLIRNAIFPAYDYFF